MTPLHLAAEVGGLDCVELLVKGGADVHALDSDGHTAEELARIHADSIIADYLRARS
jgi:ankyrin repeat protein